MISKKELYKALKEDILKNGDGPLQTITVGSESIVFDLIGEPDPVIPEDQPEEKPKKKNYNKVKDGEKD